MTRKTIGAIALAYMRSKGYQFVMCGDAHILHEIADAAGIAHRSWITEKQIINAIDRSGLFVKLFINAAGRRRVFYLPEFAPKEPK